MVTDMHCQLKACKINMSALLSGTLIWAWQLTCVLAMLISHSSKPYSSSHSGIPNATVFKVPFHLCSAQLHALNIKQLSKSGAVVCTKPRRSDIHLEEMLQGETDASW